MKKILFLSLLSMLSTSAYASHLYVGGQLGLSFLETKHTSVANSIKHDLGGFGFVGGGFVGYDFEFCKMYDLGVEVFIAGNTAENKVDYIDTDSKVRVHSTYNYGVRVLPGFQLMENVEVHLIAGYTRGNFHIKENTGISRISKTHEANGYQVGGGLTLDMGCHFAWRFDGVFNGYFYNRHHGADTGFDNRHSTRYYDFDATAGLVYKF